MGPDAGAVMNAVEVEESMYREKIKISTHYCWRWSWVGAGMRILFQLVFVGASLQKLRYAGADLKVMMYISFHLSTILSISSPRPSLRRSISLSSHIDLPSAPRVIVIGSTMANWFSLLWMAQVYRASWRWCWSPHRIIRRVRGLGGSVTRALMILTPLYIHPFQTERLGGVLAALKHRREWVSAREEREGWRGASRVCDYLCLAFCAATDGREEGVALERGCFIHSFWLLRIFTRYFLGMFRLLMNHEGYICINLC